MNKPPVAKVELVIRRPVSEVFAAFIEPEQVTQFWFERSSGALCSGAEVCWYWDQFATEFERAQSAAATRQWIEGDSVDSRTAQLAGFVWPLAARERRACISS